MADTHKNTGKTPQIQDHKDSCEVQCGNSEQESAPKQEEKLPPQQPSLLSFTLLVIYQNLYICGIDCMRHILRAKRLLKHFWVRCKGRSYALLERASIGASRFSQRLVKRVKKPFARISAVREELRPAIASAKANGKIPLTSYLAIADAVWALARSVMITLFNHIAPLLALWLFVSTVNAYINQPLALEVVYNGEVIGYVNNENDFEKASQTLRSRFITTSSTTVEIEIPQFELVCVSREASLPVSKFVENLVRIKKVDRVYTEPDELADRMVRASGNAIETAYGLYVDNRFYGAVTDRAFITGALKNIFEENATEISGERVEFIKKVALRDGLYPLSSIISQEEMGDIISSYETVNQYYIVEEGDSPMLIADKTAVPYSLLLEINPGMEKGVYVGDEILTTVARPFLSVQIVYTDIYQEAFPYETVEIENSAYARGYRQVEQTGVNGIQEVTAEITTVNGMETGRVILSTKILKEPVEERVVVGTTPPQSIQSVSPDMSGSPAVSSTGFIWPTNGGYISCGVGGYPGHSGIDIPRPPGSPVYASASGVVTISKRTYTGYGFYVMISHGNGFETLYAHCSDLYVSVGDTVAQGQVIGAVGRTGWATGNHVHFEMRYNGRIQIPQNYVSRY